jgi:hypothetical protein
MSRLKAKNALIVLLVLLTVALMYHLKVELSYAAPDNHHHFSDDGNEPYLAANWVHNADTENVGDTAATSRSDENHTQATPSAHTGG